MNPEKWKEHSDAGGVHVVPRLHDDAHFSQVGENDGAELPAEEAVDEGVHGRVAVADPQDYAAEEGKKDENSSDYRSVRGEREDPPS